MNFGDVVGQDRVKSMLRRQADTNRLPHALLLSGTEGAGKLALALALARYLLCKSPNEGEPCGHCTSCKMTKGWAHPDLHFSFPVVKRKTTDEPTSDDFLPQWRELLSDTPYFHTQRWIDKLDAQNKQMQHYVYESDSLREKLSIKPSQGGRRVVLIWLPEKMNAECANKLLKLIEEPPQHTHFILVSQQPELMLGTILSRTQTVNVPPIGESDLSEALQSRHGMPTEEADFVAHLAQGSYTRAISQLGTEDGDDETFDLFVSLMRTCYARKIKDMRAWSDKVARMGREVQKSLLSYFQRMVRENFAFNFHHQSQLNYMTHRESDFAIRFSPFINERNVEDMTRELATCQRDIEQNVNARMVFFDLTIKMTILLKR